MNSDRKVVTLDHALSVIIDHRGKTPKKLGGDFASSGVPVISAMNVKGGRLVLQEDVRYITHEMHTRWMPDSLQVGDVLLTSEAPLGEAAYLRDEARYCLGQRLFGLRANPAIIHPRFLYYLFRSSPIQHQLHARATGTTAQGIRQSELLKVVVELPPLPEQRAIAHILGTLDDKIELNRRMNETLEAMARALFKSWFVDFDPVRSKAEGQQPAGMDAETAALFPDGFEVADERQVPSGWSIKPLGDIIDLIGGGTPKTTVPEYWNGDIPWFSVVDAPSESDVFVLNTEKSITQTGLENSSTRLLMPGTTIISARGTVGKCALVAVPMAMNQSCYGVRGRDGRGNYYIYFILQNSVANLKRGSHGSVFDTITRATFDSINPVIPPIGLTVSFDNTVSPWVGRILANLRECETLTALRDTLLPKLLSGEVRVKDAETMVEEVIA